MKLSYTKYENGNILKIDDDIVKIENDTLSYIDKLPPNCELKPANIKKDKSLKKTYQKVRRFIINNPRNNNNEEENSEDNENPYEISDELKGKGFISTENGIYKKYEYKFEHFIYLKFYREGKNIKVGWYRKISESEFAPLCQNYVLKRGKTIVDNDPDMNKKLGKDTLDFNIDRGTKVIKEFITQTINEIISDYKHLKILKDLDYYKQSSKTKQNFSKQLSANKSFKFDNEYIQKNRNILRCDEDGEKIVAKFSVDSLEKVYDKLELFPPVYNMKIYDNIKKCNIEFENETKDSIIKELIARDLFIEPKVINNTRVFNKILHGLAEQDKLEINSDVYKTGYFLKDGNVIENTPITDLKPTDEDVKKSIRLLNDIIKNRGNAKQNDSISYKFMLHSPFHWILKELGYSNNNTRGLLNYGKQQTNKTTSIIMGYKFYGMQVDTDDNEITTDTHAALARNLEKSTFPLLIDEGYRLLMSEKTKSLFKKAMYGKTSTSTTDMENQTKTIERKALRTPVITFNETVKVTDGLIRRTITNYFDDSMVVDKNSREKFDAKYYPNAENSPLNDLKYLGARFRDKIIPLIEEKNPRLINIDQVTIDLLKEICDEVDVQLDEVFFNLPNYENDLAETPEDILLRELNKDFRKQVRLNPKIHYYSQVKDHAKTGIYDWLYYQHQNEVFVIQKAKFVKHCQNLVNNQISWNEIRSILGLELDNPEGNDSIKVKRKTVKGFKLSTEELCECIFNLDEDEDDFPQYCPVILLTDNRDDKLILTVTTNYESSLYYFKNGEDTIAYMPINQPYDYDFSTFNEDVEGFTLHYEDYNKYIFKT